MTKQLLIVLLLVLFMPYIIYGDDHDTYAKYDVSGITYDSNKTAYVYLDHDVSLSDTLTVKDGYTLYLCLHGHSLAIEGNKEVIKVNSKGRLIISDCTSSGSITSSKSNAIVNNGTLDFNSGHISGNGNSGVLNSGTFNMHGGTISSNSASLGAGVYNEGTFNMYSGTIEDNVASNNGGGVYNNGSYAVFKMYNDSSIRNNQTGKYGGGIYNNNSTFVMYDTSSISNNVSNYMYGGGLYAYNSTITIRDSASIVDNSSNVSGGDVYLNSGTFYINDNIRINDLYLPSNRTITVLDKLDDNASIGLSAQHPNDLPVLVINYSDLNPFHYNDTSYELEVVNNNIKLKKATQYPTYSIDIPSSISFNKDLEVRVSIDSGSKLSVKLSSDNNFTLINEDDVSISYLIKQDDRALSISDTILELNGGSASTFLSFELIDSLKYSGTYTGTVMFTVYINEK